MVSIVADFLIAVNICGITPSDVPVAPVIRRYGFNLEDFMPDGGLGSRITDEISKTERFLDQHQRRCSDLVKTVQKYFPELMR